MRHAWVCVWQVGMSVCVCTDYSDANWQLSQGALQWQKQTHAHTLMSTTTFNTLGL